MRLIYRYNSTDNMYYVSRSSSGDLLARAYHTTYQNKNVIMWEKAFSGNWFISENVERFEQDLFVSYGER